MKSVAISEFKAHCLTLLEDVARTGEPILVTKRGKPLARVTPSGNTDALSPQDTLHGTVEILGDVLEPLIPRSAWNAARGVLLTQEEKPRVQPRRAMKRPRG
jgi:prevent-host-death family protein